MLTFVDIQIIKPCEATRVSWLYACATWGAWDKVELTNLALMGRMTASFYIIWRNEISTYRSSNLTLWILSFVIWFHSILMQLNSESTAAE